MTQRVVRLLSMAFCGAWLCPPAIGALTVEGAYRAIPHARTVFDPSSAKMPAAERAYLARCFELVDQAIVERVRVMAALRSSPLGGPAGTERYDVILRDLDALQLPEPLHEVHRLVTEAIREQRMFLEEWDRRLRAGELAPEARPDLQRDALVSGASRKLRAAYQALMQHVPDEGPQNRQAFYDYLCALDFL